MARDREVDLVCIDVSGTTTEGSLGAPLPGAVEAVRHIAERLPVRFVTNVTSQPARAIAEGADVPLDRMAMVGDDAEFDVAAPIDLGLKGVLVRTGKYRDGDEDRVTPRPTAVLDSIADLPDWLGVGPSR